MIHLLYIFLILFYTQIFNKNKEEKLIFSVKDQSVLHLYALKGNKSFSINLPKDLSEISGIIIYKGNRIFAHNDEEGVIYQVDYSTGKIIKTFSIGKRIKLKDFEDITVANNKFFLITSSGTIYKFNEGADRSNVDCEMYDTGLNKHNDVEGLCYDPVTNSLLIACKGFPGEGFENCKTIYSFSLNDYKLDRKPRFILNLTEIENRFKIKKISPSGIARYPKNGNFFILSSHARAVIEISPEGKILAAEKLSKELHPQPEGITFADDYTLLISDENNDGGIITFYKPEN